MKTATSAPNFNYGFPTPGPQRPDGNAVMDHVFFVSEQEWKEVRENERFDYIVIGTGFTCLAFTARMLERRPEARILLVERGPFFLPQHFQNLPLPFVQTLGGLSETFPWTLSARTVAGEPIKWQHGMVPFFGGRSTLWSGWCPRPTEKEMEGWPKAVIEAAGRYFASAEKLLNVVSANDIDTGSWSGVCPVYGVLQKRLFRYLEAGLGRIPSATRVIPAPLAVAPAALHGVDFEKFSAPGPLLSLVASHNAALADSGKGPAVRVVTNCIVERVLQQDGRATALETSRGVVNVGDAELVLAMGTIPPTTLVLNSFPQVPGAGARFTAHFITAIVARVPREDYPFAGELDDLELAAIYLAGVDSRTGGQYHVQLTALSDRDPEANATTALRHMPDVVATASMEQLRSSKDSVIFVCAVLGELDRANPDNWLRPLRDSDAPRTENVMLQVIANRNDLSVWETMDAGTFDALEKVLSPKGAERVEYWHATAGGGEWRRGRPGPELIRVPALVHEGSTLWIGEEGSAPVGLDYRLRGVENVYVTGGGLWPNGGSWNPTMTMCALAQHLADSLVAGAGPSPLLGARSLEETKTGSPMT